MMKKFIYPFLLLVWLTQPKPAIPATHGIQDIKTTINHILKRFRNELTHAEIESLTQKTVLGLLTPGEKEILGSGYLGFHTDRPVTVFIACYEHDSLPFWLSEPEFQRTTYTINSSKQRAYHVWKREYSAGDIRLGVPSIAKCKYHYLIFIKSMQNQTVQITDLSPDNYEITNPVNTGTTLYVDRTDTIDFFSGELTGSQFIRTAHTNATIGQLLNKLFITPFPSSPEPDQIVLSWEGDPRITQTISWRTDTTVSEGYVRYQPAQKDHSSFQQEPLIARAITKRIETPDIVNDPVIHRYSVTLTSMTSGTHYIYSIGDGKTNWSDSYGFRTAPAGTEPFSFMYLGDVQEGYEQWNLLMKNALRFRPDISFILIAGDLVDKGINRCEWDEFFAQAGDIFAMIPLMPAMGDNDSRGGKFPELYLDLFRLPQNGPQNITPKRVYSFTYNNAAFYVLDSNENMESQVLWLDNQLAQCQATWKFIMLHHPIYYARSRGGQQNPRSVLVPVCDKYHINMVFQGHDHAYIRTYPLNNNRIMTSAREGTVYMVSTAGTKVYPSDDLDYIEYHIDNQTTFQIIDIQLDDDKLLYRCYDMNCKQLDEMVIEK